jgi:hypothetical protein
MFQEKRQRGRKKGGLSYEDNDQNSEDEGSIETLSTERNKKLNHASTDIMDENSKISFR